MNRFSRIVVLTSSIGCITCGLAHAQESESDDANELSQVIVTGTRVANRSALDTAVPVDVVTSETLSNAGITEINQALSTALPSFNFPRPGLADGTDTIRPATLRGLAPDQTLVLLNSKRRHPSSLVNVNGTIGRGAAAVDLNTIPDGSRADHRSAARWRLGAVRLGRDRRRHQRAPARSARRRRGHVHLWPVRHRATNRRT